MVTLQVYRKLETYLNDGLLEVDSRLERHEGEREGEIWFLGGRAATGVRTVCCKTL